MSKWHTTWTTVEKMRALTVENMAKGHQKEHRAFFDDSKNGNSDPMKWLGVSSRKMVVEMYGKGWKQGLNKVNENIKKVSIQPLPSQRRKSVYALTGETLNMQRVYAGQVKAWRTGARRPAGVSTKPVTILVHICANAHVSSEKMFLTGAVCVVLSDALEAAGMSTEIIGITATNGGLQGGPRKSRIIFPIKKSGDPLELEMVIYTTGLSGFFRTYIFRQECCLPWPAASGFGQAASGEDDWGKEIYEDNTDDDNVIAIPQFDTVEKACGFLKTVQDKFREVAHGR